MLYVFRLRSYLSEKVHMMGYRMCVSSLTAIITYHNRYSKKNPNKHQPYSNPWQHHVVWQENSFNVMSRFKISLLTTNMADFHYFVLCLCVLSAEKTNQRMVVYVWPITRHPLTWSSWPVIAATLWYTILFLWVCVHQHLSEYLRWAEVLFLNLALRLDRCIVGCWGWSKEEWSNPPRTSGLTDQKSKTDT